MSLLTFERPTCGQVIGSTMTPPWLRFYAGSRCINEPATHDERWWLWTSIIIITLFFFLQHIAASKHRFHDTSIVFFFLAGTVRKTEKHTTHTHICTLAHTRAHTQHHSPLIKKHFGFLFTVCFICVLAYYHYHYYYYYYSTVQVTLLFCFNFGLSCWFLLLFVAFIGYPRVKFKMYQTKTHNHKKGKRREFPLYGVQKRKSKTYIHTHTTTTRSTRTTHSAPMQLPPYIINNQTQSQWYPLP